jgi:hypothetical protein
MGRYRSTRAQTDPRMEPSPPGSETLTRDRLLSNVSLVSQHGSVANDSPSARLRKPFESGTESGREVQNSPPLCPTAAGSDENEIRSSSPEREALEGAKPKWPFLRFLPRSSSERMQNQGAGWVSSPFLVYRLPGEVAARVTAFFWVGKRKQPSVFVSFDASYPFRPLSRFRPSAAPASSPARGWCRRTPLHRERRRSVTPSYQGTCVGWAIDR